MPAWRQQLPQRHRGEDADEGAEADNRLVREQDLGHRHGSLRSTA